MGKLSVEISDELEERLRKYIAEHFWKNPKGKLSAIIEEALQLWFSRKGEAKPNE